MAEHQSRQQDRQKAFNPPGVQEPFNNDLDLKDRVKSALLEQTESAGIDVQVSAEDGVVRLHGVVDVLSHKSAAENIARGIMGVTLVENDITVANEETASDHDLYKAITNKLGNRRELQSIGCRVHRGIVTLVGHAGSADNVTHAVKLIEDMAGVREVKIKRIKLGEGEKEDDADVARQAERLIDQMGFDHTLFAVYCDAGVLFVKGFVPSREDRSRLKIAMHKIPGVDKLEALLITDDQMDRTDAVH